MSCFHRKHLFLRCRTVLLGRRVQHALRKQQLCSQHENKAPLGFDTVLSKRRRESSASVLVEIENRHKIDDLYQECLQYGNLQKVYLYTNNSHKCQVLLEFNSPDEALGLLNGCKHLSSDGFPVRSRLLRFVPKNGSRRDKKSATVNIETSANITPQAQATKLVQSDTIAEQMKHFYETEKLSDLETRLGFMVCKQVEEFISGLYPKGQVLPFGSLVNGFGRHHCDIDMVYCVPDAT